MKIIIVIFLLFLAGCTTTKNQSAGGNLLSASDTMEIIRSAAESAPKGVNGEYLLTIKTTGKQGNLVFLNTELDYRDQRNVTVALTPNVIVQLRNKYGLSPEQSPEQFFVNKRTLVKGKAERIKVDFISSSNNPSGKYYYQTHIRVSKMSQIEIVSENT